MSKAVVLSIRPEWVEKIANGEKTIEVRKTKPKLETPFKCYIYCTNIRPFLVWGDVFRGDWFTEFTRISGYSRAEADKIWDVFNGHIAGEFTCDRIYELAPLNHAPDDIEKQACLTREEIVNYLKGTGYGWHISDLKIYDAPKKLGEFWRDCLEYSELSTNCWSCENVCGDGDETDCNTDGQLYLHRAPQSWCYVEEG
jgi:predicted transcriptional regulator